MSIYLDIHRNAETITEALDHMLALDHDDLAKRAINNLLNDFIRATHDRQEDVDTNDEHHVPYFGWYWRDVDFFNPDETCIATGEGYTGICQNNKWSHADRALTMPELEEFRDKVFVAYKASRKGGLLSEIWAETDALLSNAGDFIRDLHADWDDR